MYLCQASYTDLSTGPLISPVSKPHVLIVGLAQGGWGNSQIWHDIGSYSCKLKVHKCRCDMVRENKEEKRSTLNIAGNI